MTTTPDDRPSIWVVSDLGMDRRNYIATVHFTPTLSHTLHNDEAGIRYASTLLRAAAAAESDAAVFIQLKAKLEVGNEEAARLVNQLRNRRRTQVLKAGPLKVTPSVSANSGRPFLKCEVREVEPWSWDPASARQHAHHVLETTTVADADTTYRAFLVDQVKLEPGAALEMVRDLINFREGK